MAELNDIYKRTLLRCNRVGLGQTPTADQISVMEGNLNSLYAYLLENDYVDYDIDDIPTKDDDSIITILAYRSRLDLSLSAERTADLRNEQRRAWQVLFANNQVKTNSQPAEANYF